LTSLTNQDIRAKILEDLYNRKQVGQTILSTVSEYAKLLNIPGDLANFNLQYLVNAGLISGYSSGFGSNWVYITDITSFGIEAVEGGAQENLAVNFSIININAPVTQSQVASGTAITQTQSINIATPAELEQYLKQHFQGRQEIEELKVILKELEQQHKVDVVKPSTLKRVNDIVSALGPTAAVVMEFVLKYYLGVGK
jgi:formate dehydrogenase assembly factor FdhD